MKGVGLATTIVAGPEVGVPIYAVGTRMGQAAEAGKALTAADKGNYKEAAIRLGSIAVSEKAGRMIDKSAVDEGRKLGISAATDVGVDAAKERALKATEKPERNTSNDKAETSPKE